MLTIRNEQLAVFEYASLLALEPRLVDHLREEFPVDFELAGESAIRECVHQAVGRADHYKLTTRGQFCRYVQLAVTFGTHFDRDPLLPWAASALRNPRLPRPDARMDRLDHHVMRQLGQVAGETGEHYRKAVLRLRRLAPEQFSCPPEDLEPAMWALLEGQYPELYTAAPDAGLKEFARIATNLIRERGLLPDRGALIVPVLMFMLGSHAAEDPLYPWIGSTLSDATRTEPGTKELALINEAREFLERALTLMRAAGDG